MSRPVVSVQALPLSRVDHPVVRAVVWQVRHQLPRSGYWRVDETYGQVSGRWKYLFRAVDKHGQLIDFMLSARRNTRAAYRVLCKTVKTMSNCPPSSITTDKLVSYSRAIKYDMAIANKFRGRSAW